MAVFLLRLRNKLLGPFRRAFWYSYVRGSGVVSGSGLRLYGRPTISRHPKSSITIGKDAILCSDSEYNEIGINHEVVLSTKRDGAVIRIGDHFGMSGGAISARESIVMGNNVMIGANVTISDNDSHPIGAVLRRSGNKTSVSTKPVNIGDDVWIGADCYIGRGVSIGNNVVIGARSVVTKSIPSDCVAAGVPCRVIREI